MLFTRCPDCETTFRITAEALRKADGQVRCGRCACVFNGYTELRRRTRRRARSGLDETAPGAFERVPAPENATAAAARRAGTQGEAHVLQLGVEAQSAALPAAKKPGEKPSDGVPAKAVPESGSPQPGDSQKDTAVGEFSLAGVIAELEASAAPDTDPPDASSSPLGLLVKSGPEQAREAAVTGAGRGAHTSERSSALAAPSWVILDEARPQRIPPLAWKIGCGAAAALLLLQVLHHYRAELAVLGVVGPMVRQTYAALG